MRMPVSFLGHGSPMNALADNSYTWALNRLAGEIPRPKAILVVSAHWITRGTHVSCAETPRIIHDFYGFPKALYAIEYPCPGAPEEARKTCSLVRSTPVDCQDDWGIDHAAWAILRHVFPEADVPVYEMSLDVAKPPEYHYRIGQDLSALRDEGVWVVGSGNIVHNLSVADFDNSAAQPYPWAEKFDEMVRDWIAKKSFESLIRYQKLPEAAMAVPTNEHYLPLLYVLGTIGAADEVRIVHEEIQNASVSMLCVMASDSGS